MQGFFCSRRYFQQRSAPTLSPSLDAQTSTPTSAARTPDCISPAKSKLPGVSSTLILTPWYMTGAIAREMEIWRLVSSGS